MSKTIKHAAVMLTMILSVGCGMKNMTTRQAKMEPTAEQWRVFIVAATRIIEDPANGCKGGRTAGIGESECPLLGELIERIEFPVANSRLDAEVFINPQFCVDPTALALSLPKEWGFQLDAGAGGSSNDSINNTIREVYDSGVLGARVVMTLDPHAELLCLSSFRVIDWQITGSETKK